ncbi:MAG: addiction module protein [Gemmatimonadetes bacterium]|nr:addiction module protein [Gemmatimonadota bacterium]
MSADAAFDYRRLTIAERLQLVEDIWDSIAEDADAATLPLSEAELAELERRRAEMEANPGRGEAWDVVRARIIDRMSR